MLSAEAGRSMCLNLIYIAIAFKLILETVSIISSDLPFIEWHVRFTTIFFKPLLSKIWQEIKGQAKKPRECTLARRVQCSL